MLSGMSLIRHQTWILLISLLMLSMMLPLVNGAAISSTARENKIKRQAEMVRCFTDRTDSQCGGTAMIETDSIASCCQGEGYFYSLQDSTTCETCILIGWFNVTTQMNIDSFTAREDPLGYDLRVDYIKGSGASNLQFMVMAIPITASASDFTLSSTIVNLGSADLGSRNIRIVLRTDALALEEDEVLQLILTPTSNTAARNEFLRDTINVTIIDNDIASVFFSEVDYSLIPEDDQNLTAVVVRSIAIATPISVLVYPLNNTYVNQTRVPGTPPIIFEGEPLQISEQTVIPPDNRIRPTVAASGADFDTAPIRIVMEPSEFSQQDYPFTVKVVADKINEATQNFVLVLRLESAIRRESVNTAVRNSTRCIISDDDPIFLSFEFPVYDLLETQFEEFYEDVTVIKSNNLMTEQQLQIWFQLESPMNTTIPPATRDMDYLFGTQMAQVVRPINSFEQRVQLPITVIADDVLEGVESFGIGISNNINSVAFQFGDFPSTVVNIIESKSVTVGFERNFTLISEDAGSFELCVNISTPDITISENVQFSLRLFSIQDTADEADFVEINSSNNPLVAFTSDPSTHRQCFNVTITDDEVLEDTQRFSLKLTLNDRSERLNVLINPDISLVEITDSDEVTVGFERTFTSVNESTGSFELCIRIFTDVTLLNISFIFNLDLISVPITADATDYDEFISSNKPLVAFTSDPSTHRQCFDVNITNDGVLEDTESFFLSLTLAEGSTVPVSISPNTSNVDIIDDDVAVVGFERVFTSIDEDAGSFQLCVRIVTDASLLPISTEFFLDLLSVPASADATDYAEITSSNNPLVAFTSDPSTHRQCFNVNITDDEALEDTERFNLRLTLLGGSIPVVVSPDISVVDIIDNDFIRVGFEMDFISVSESNGSVELCVRIFTDAALFPNHEEINFFLNLMSTTGSASATDYVEITASNNPLVAFTSDPSTHRQCFNVTITDDEALEDTENFFLNLTLGENSTVPVIILPDSTQVDINDDDVITVGFDRNFTSVSEGIGSLELCVRIFTEAELLPGMFEFSLDLATSANTADGDDYKEISASNNPFVSFTQDPSTHRQCFDVNITDDEFLEDTEQFNLILSLAEASTVPVEIVPPMSEVEIIDDDVILVGFEETFSSVDEDSGSFQLCVRIFTDPAFLPTHISPNFSLSLVSIPGTADGTDYDEFTSLTNPLVAFTSDPSTHRQCFNVNITDDRILEDTERFSLRLTLADSNVPVLVNPEISEVEIIDKDFLAVGFETIFSSVGEEIGSFELCLRIFTEAALLPTYTNFSFSLDLTSVPGTADRTDYDEFTSSNNPLVAFTSDPFTHRQCFEVNITNDRAVESTEGFNLSLALVDGSNIPVSVNPDTSEVEITDNDYILVGFEKTFTSVNESIGLFELCVEIFTDPSLLPASFDFILNLFTIPGTAGAADFVEITASNSPLVAFTSDPSTHRQCFNVNITNDRVLEDMENFSLNLSLSEEPRFPVIIVPDSSEVEIKDQDFIVVGFERIFTSVVEDDGSFELCVSILTDSALLPTHTVVNFTLDLLSVPETAGPSDYTEITSSNNPLVAFTSDPSTHRQCFNVTITDDGALEDTERFSLHLTLADSNVPVVVNPDVSEVEIVDEDMLVVGFETDFTSVNESVGTFELCVRIFTEAALLPTYTNFSFSLDLISISGSADGTDYAEITSSNNPLVAFTSDPSTHRQCFNVNITDDKALEDTERFSLSLDLVAGANIPVVVRPDISEVNILDNDVILVGFERNYTRVDEETGSFELCVVIFTDISLLPTSFEFLLNLNTLPGTAGSADFDEITPSNNPLTLFTSDPSTHRQCFNVTITNDDILEDVERFSLSSTLAEGSTVPVVVSPDISEVEIEDRDFITVGFDRIFTSIDEGNGSFELCVSILTDSALLPTHTVVNFTLDLLSVPRTADTTDYAEFSPSNNPLMAFTSDPSTHRQCFDVTIIDDEVLEDTEMFNLRLSLAGVPSVPVVVRPDLSEVEIIDDDVIFVGFEKNFTSIDEDIGSFELCIAIFTNSSFLPANFEFSLNLITISGTADATDYAEITSSNNPLVPFTSDPSTHRQCFNVTITDDDALEDTERFNLSLSLADGFTVPVMIIPDSSEVEIQDNDFITVGFEQIVTSVVEDDGSFELCVSILTDSALLPTHTVVNFTLDLLSVPRTADATDYAEFSSSNNPLVTFTSDPSTHRQCFNVTITDDKALEDTETFSLRLALAGVSSVPVFISPDVSEVEILDEDEILVGFETVFISADEGNDTVELCVSIFTDAALLPTHLNMSFSLDLISVPGTADSEDYVEIDSSNNPLMAFTSDPSTHKQCSEVNIIDDGALEDTEDFSLQLSLAEGSNVPVSVSPDESTVEISDNDYVIIGFELASVTAEETVGVVTLVVSVLDGGTTTPITVTIATQNGSATSLLDFIDIEQLLFFNETMTSHDIEVLIINDGIPELNERFLAVLTLVDPLLPPSKILISPGVANITIVDGSPVDHVNDTVIGDPLLTVPLLVSNLDDLGLDQNLSLCYEVHGQSDKYFNLVSDICTSVSAHYLGVSSFNVIDGIGVRAVDNARNCRNILVSKEGGGTVTVDGEVITRFSEGGISVRKYQHHVRIAVPNCAHVDLIMWIICQNRTLTDYNDQGDKVSVSVTMMKFVIARGFNLQESSHGIVGQFWNVPVIAEPYNGTVFDVDPQSSLNFYTVTVSHPESSVRRFAAFLWPRSWEVVRGEYQPCLYAGSHQAGNTDEIEGYGDPVIEGLYTDYIVSGPFDTAFEYSRFEQRRCR